MKKKLQKEDIVVKDITSSKNIKLGMISLAIGSLLSLSSCELSDSKSCSDYDQSADGNGSSAYDTGYYADSYDYGGDTDTGYGDSAGNGDRCADFD